MVLRGGGCRYLVQGYVSKLGLSFPQNPFINFTLKKFSFRLYIFPIPLCDSSYTVLFYPKSSSLSALPWSFQHSAANIACKKKKAALGQEC